MAGTIIEVEIVYENMRKFLSSFGLSQVRYAYKVVEKKLPYISREWLATVQPVDYPETRRYVIQHGVLIVFNISGVPPTTPLPPVELWSGCQKPEDGANFLIFGTGYDAQFWF